MISRFIRFGVVGNSYFLFHCGAGAFLYCIARAIHLSKPHALLATLGCTLIWEVYEYVKDDVDLIYGSKARFFYDAAGDVLGAMAVAGIVAVFV